MSVTMSVSEQIDLAIEQCDSKKLEELLSGTGAKKALVEIACPMRMAIRPIGGGVTQEQQIKTVQLLLAYRADIDESSSLGDTALHAACDLGTQEWLVMAGAAIDRKNYTRSTPLHERCREESANISNILLLIKNKADPMAKDVDEFTPFFYYYWRLYKKILKCDAESKEVKELSETMSALLREISPDNLEKQIASLYSDGTSRLENYLGTYFGHRYFEYFGIDRRDKDHPGIKSLFTILLSYLNHCTLTDPPLPGILKLKEHAIFVLGEDHLLLEKLNHLKKKSPSA